MLQIAINRKIWLTGVLDLAFFSGATQLRGEGNTILTGGFEVKLLHLCTIVLGLVPVVALAAENKTLPPRQAVSNSNTVGNPAYGGQKIDRSIDSVREPQRSKTPTKPNCDIH